MTLNILSTVALEIGRQTSVDTSWVRCGKRGIPRLLWDAMADQNWSSGVESFTERDVCRRRCHSSSTPETSIPTFPRERNCTAMSVKDRELLRLRIDAGSIEPTFFRIITLSGSRFFNCIAVSKRNSARRIRTSASTSGQKTFVLSVSNLCLSKNLINTTESDV